MTLLEWIKANVKEGADISEAENLVKDLDPLKNITTADQALDFMDRNGVFKSALDRETTKRVESALTKFQESKLPEILKAEGEKIRKELNPEETPEQKELREIREELAKERQEKADMKRKAELRAKAKEIADKEKVPYDPLRAERFSLFGDDAEKLLADDINYLKTTVENQLATKLKQQFTTAPPQGGNIDPATIDDQILAAKKNGDLTTASRLIVEKTKAQQAAAQ